MTTVLLIASFDSGLKYAARLADAAEALGAVPVLRAPTTVAPHSLGPRQTAAATARPVSFAPWSELVHAALRHDVVVPVFDGPTVERFLREVHEQGRRQGKRLPVFGSGYVGMTLYDIVGGYLMRSLADVVAVNSRTDLAEFARAAGALRLPTDNLLLAGLALLPAAPAAARGGPIETVLFADQPTVPRAAAEREYVWDRVLAYAQLHPDRTVLLRPRHRPGEDTFHRMRFSPDSWAAGRELPPNLRIEHTPIGDLLTTSDLVLTVSSTAGLEAVAAGTRVAFVADFLNDAALNPRLLASGLLRRFDDIDVDEVDDPDPAWLDDVFPSASGPVPAERFVARLLELTAESTDRPHDRMWSSSFHIGRRATDAALAASRAGAAGRYAPRRLAAGALRRALQVVGA